MLEIILAYVDVLNYVQTQPFNVLISHDTQCVTVHLGVDLPLIVAMLCTFCVPSCTRLLPCLPNVLAAAVPTHYPFRAPCSELFAQARATSALHPFLSHHSSPCTQIMSHTSAFVQCINAQYDSETSMEFYKHAMGGGSDYCHYGVFNSPDDDLATATHNSVVLLSELARRCATPPPPHAHPCTPQQPLPAISPGTCLPPRFSRVNKGTNPAV